MACCHIWETAYSSGPYLSGGGGKGGRGGGGGRDCSSSSFIYVALNLVVICL